MAVCGNRPISSGAINTPNQRRFRRRVVATASVIRLLHYEFADSSATSGLTDQHNAFSGLSARGANNAPLLGVEGPEQDQHDYVNHRTHKDDQRQRP